MSIISECPIEQLKQYVKESTSIKELQVKLGYSPNSGVTKTIKDFCQRNNISLEHFTSLSKSSIKRSPENIFVENSSASQTVLREWYTKGKYTEYCCAICGQGPVWQNKPLSLTLDHINGINTDDRLENLRWVCPNCDRQLETFGSKNNKKPRANAAEKFYCQNCGKEISRGSTHCAACYGLSQRKKQRPDINTLKQILIENNGNFSAVGRLYKVSDNTIRHWCKEYDLSHHSSDYKIRK